MQGILILLYKLHIMVRKYLDLELLYSLLTVPFVLFITCEP